MRSFLLAITLAGPLATGIAAPAAKEPPPVPVRFYCGEFRTLTRYIKNGTEVAPKTFGDRPPGRFVIPGKGENVTAVSWSPGRMTAETPVPVSCLKDGKLTLFAENTDAAATAPKAGAKGAPQVPLVPFAELALPVPPSASDAKSPAPVSPAPQLAVVYQPEVGAKWMMPKSFLLDLSPTRFPVGGCALTNLTTHPIQVLLGAKGAAVVVNPGSAKIVFGFDRDADDYTMVRLAIASPQGGKVLVNGLRQIPKSGRQMLVVSAVDPVIGGGLPASVKMVSVD